MVKWCHSTLREPLWALESNSKGSPLSLQSDHQHKAVVLIFIIGHPHQTEMKLFKIQSSLTKSIFTSIPTIFFKILCIIKPHHICVNQCSIFLLETSKLRVYLGRKSCLYFYQEYSNWNGKDYVENIKILSKSLFYTKVQIVGISCGPTLVFDRVQILTALTRHTAYQNKMTEESN